MSQEFFAVTDMSLDFVNSGDSGDITITGSPSTKVKADNKFVYQEGTIITITNGSNGSITNATGSGAMVATTTKNFAENKRMLRNGDRSAPIIMTGTNPSPPPATATYVTVVEIDDPNQTKWKGE